MAESQNVTFKRCAKETPKKGRSAKKIFVAFGKENTRPFPTANKPIIPKPPILNAVKLHNSCVQVGTFFLVCCVTCLGCK